MPASPSARSKSFPAGPTNGRPARSSSLPGCSPTRSEEHTSELQSPCNLVCRLLLGKKKPRTSRGGQPGLTRPVSYGGTRPAPTYAPPLHDALPIFPLEVLDHVGHVGARAVDAGLAQRPVEELPRRAHERTARQVLVVAGLLAHEIGRAHV